MMVMITWSDDNKKEACPDTSLLTKCYKINNKKTKNRFGAVKLVLRPQGGG